MYADSRCSRNRKRTLEYVAGLGQGRTFCWTVTMLLQLLLTLFRIIEPASGAIFIDDVDITKLGLHDCASFLSSELSILGLGHPLILIKST